MEKNNEILEWLSSKGVEVSKADLAIAEAISALAEKTAITEKRDMDGLVVDEVVGFVRDPQVEGLISSFPNAALYLFNTEGDVEKMVESYLRGGYVHIMNRQANNEPYKERMLYSSKEEYKQESLNYGPGYSQQLYSSKCVSMPSAEACDNYTEYSARELNAMERYNKFVETYGKGCKIEIPGKEAGKHK